MSELIPAASTGIQSTSERGCRDLAAAGFDSQKASEQTWEALLSAGSLERGAYTLASGQRANIKVNAERLYDHPRQLEVVCDIPMRTSGRCAAVCS